LETSENGYFPLRSSPQGAKKSGREGPIRPGCLQVIVLQ
jgi:hypothetical protein